MGQRSGLVLGQRLQPVAPNLLKITNISILVVPNTPTTRMLILLILIILPATPFPLSSPPAFHTAPIPARHSPYPQHSTSLLFPRAIPLIPAFHTTPIPARHSPYPPAFHTTSCSRTPFPLSPSIPHHSCSRTPFPLSPAFHTTPIPARHSPYPTSIPHSSYSRTPDTAHSPVTDPVEASAHPMLDGDSLPVRYGVHGQRQA